MAEQFAQLADSGKQRHQVLTRYILQQMAVAESLAENPSFIKDFNLMKKLVATPNSSDYKTLERQFEEHFAYLLEGVYDLLLINGQGDIFFSIKKEADLGLNLFDSALQQTHLAKVIAQKPQQTQFVDFEPYSASGELAAFIVVPLGDNYVVFQLPINSIDAIMQFTSNMGRTGETYLVNPQHQQVTSSRFFNTHSTLQTQVATPAAQQSILGKTGNEIILDYRQIKVMSHYQPFEIAGVAGLKWGLISEMDLSEVMASYYLANQTELYPLLVTKLLETTPTHQAATESASQPYATNLYINSLDKRVEMGEFVRLALHQEYGIYSLGAATCSLVSVVMPNEFAYLMHIPPTDKVYINGLNEGSHLLAQALYKIQYFDLPPAKLGQLQFDISAVHLESLQGVLHYLLQQGIAPTQIFLNIEQQASSVNQSINPDGNIQLEWLNNHGVLVVPPTRVRLSTILLEVLAKHAN